MSLTFLEKRAYTRIEYESPGSRVKVIVLTAEGRQAQDNYRRLIWDIEERWHSRFGKDAIRRLRKSLDQLLGEPTSRLSPLFRGLEPYPHRWRASLPKPEGLPHYPMVLHRGGYPDGS